jgi:hypothetical protein
MLVEEAGQVLELGFTCTIYRTFCLLIGDSLQVLESHVLGSLVPSIEHLVLIGDPLQLRPTLNNFCMWS